MNSNSIRLVKSQDIPVLKSIIDDNQMFPSEMLDDMIAPFLEKHGETNQSLVTVNAALNEQGYWFTYDADGPCAVAYLCPEKMTEGCWNLLLIAVDVRHHSRGIGQQLMAFLEQLLRESDQHLLLVETSGNPEFERTRQFYIQAGYDHEASIRDYYQLGEDKIVFSKHLLR
jgi:GNAT superfamily N-acetyltransferase